jgi:hypothetical protein
MRTRGHPFQISGGGAAPATGSYWVESTAKAPGLNYSWSYSGTYIYLSSSAVAVRKAVRPPTEWIALVGAPVREDYAGQDTRTLEKMQRWGWSAGYP